MKAFLCILVALVAQSMALPFEGRIVGGRPASPGEFRHQISLQMNGQHFCGGSIINANTILTAAHCMSGSIAGMEGVAGITNLNEGGQRRRIVSQNVHPGFNQQEFAYDVAVLKVDIPFDFGGNVQPITLRNYNNQYAEVLTLSGWGLTSYPGNIPADLQTIDLSSIDIDSCAQNLGGQGFPITSGNICTLSPAGYGACQGDSGGPLIDKLGQQIGIVSWGIPCANGYPDMFTSVPFFLSWIQQYL